MITIEIVSDIVCPWCFMGKRRLEAATAEVRRQVPDFVCRKLWRPFFLNPDTLPEGEPYLPFLVKKFGGQEQVEVLFERVRTAGRAHGLEYAFEKIQLRANTLMAHRLLHWAQERGDADRLVERLFVAQFQRGEHVGDLAVLVTIAAECGYDAKEVEDYLASDQDEQLVMAAERKARERGIIMVPTFVIEGRHVIVGAEDPSVLAEGIRRVLV
ncbi:MAG TPA: DsbA family oxidoreductase [Rhodocyclaceae bacterium]|nr:DsbA family oxidoreductase [Rhodocyclaceae bacterium]